MARLDLDALFPGSIVTVYPPDQVDAVESTMVMTGKDRNQAGEVLRRLSDDIFKTSKLLVLKLPGEGNRKTKTLHFRDAIELIMVLPGKIAKQTRQQFADIITRYFAGDDSLVPEIEANAASDHPINHMAREAVREKEVEEADPFIVGHKRKLLELEIERTALEIERTSIENARMRQENLLQEKERTMALTLQGIKSVADLCPMGVLDERSRLLFKDLVTNLVMQAVHPLALPAPPSTSSTSTSSGAAGGGMPCAPPSSSPPQGISNFLTISTVAASMGHAKLTNAQLQRIGVAVSKAYVARYGCKPSKHDQFVDGAVRQVCTYEDKDRDLLEEGVRQGLDL